jgi:hypothetical protein
MLDRMKSVGRLLAALFLAAEACLVTSDGRGTPLFHWGSTIAIDKFVLQRSTHAAKYRKIFQNFPKYLKT